MIIAEHLLSKSAAALLAGPIGTVDVATAAMDDIFETRHWAEMFTISVELVKNYLKVELV